MNTNASAVHPWPQAQPLRVEGAIDEAAYQCCLTGYSAQHAALVIMHWNRMNVAPAPDRDVVLQVGRVYAAHDSGEGEQRAAASAVKQLDLYSERFERVPPREWLIPQVLPAAGRVALVGHPGMGKSWLGLDMAAAISSGSRFLGSIAPAIRGNAVIVDGEGGRTRAIRRMSALATGRGIEPDPEFRIIWRDGADFSLVSPMALDGLCREFERLRPKLIVFDTLAKVMGMNDENSNSAAARLTAAMHRITTCIDATLLFLAHPAKSDASTTSVRGAYELTADLDMIWTIRAAGQGAGILTCHKDRDQDAGNRSFGFAINANGDHTVVRLDAVSLTTMADALDEEIMGILGERAEVRTGDVIAQCEESSRASIYRALRRLQGQGRIRSPGHGVWRAMASVQEGLG